MKIELIIDFTFDVDILYKRLQELAEKYIQGGLVVVVNLDYSGYCIKLKIFLSDFELFNKLMLLQKEVIELGISYQKGELV